MLKSITASHLLSIAAAVLVVASAGLVLEKASALPASAAVVILEAGPAGTTYAVPAASDVFAKLEGVSVPAPAKDYSID